MAQSCEEPWWPHSAGHAPAEQPEPSISWKMEQHLCFSSAHTASLHSSPSLRILLQWIKYLRWHFTEATKTVRGVQCWKKYFWLSSSAALHSVGIFLSITIRSSKLRDQSQICPQMRKFCYFHFVYKIEVNCNLLFFFCGQNEFGFFHFSFGIPSCWQHDLHKITFCW